MAPRMNNVIPYINQIGFGVLFEIKIPVTKNIKPKNGPFLVLKSSSIPIGVKAYAFARTPNIYNEVAKNISNFFFAIL